MIKLDNKQKILIILTICLNGYLFYAIKHERKSYKNKIQSYEYLSKYHCWNGIFRTTMYTLHPSECSKDKEHRYFGITKSGNRAVKGRTVAVDPKVVPLGSILIDIETGIKYIAEDTGNEIKGYDLDIFVGQGTKENVKKAQDFGVKNKLFIVIE